MAKTYSNSLFFVEDDGFATHICGSWNIGKLQIILSYLRGYFNRLDLKNKRKILLDIGSGPGINQLDTGGTIVGTPLLGLSLKQRFTKYIFCDKNVDYTNALKIRVNKFFPNENVLILEGDININIEKIPPYILDPTRKSGTSILCLVDLFSYNMYFETIKFLSQYPVDFLFIQAFPHLGSPSYSDNTDEYYQELTNFFGKSWPSGSSHINVDNNVEFFMHGIKLYHQQMKSLGFHVTGSLQKYHPSPGSIPYYHISYCTKSRLFEEVKTKALQMVYPQMDLFE